MPIVVNISVMMSKRKVNLKDLSARVGMHPAYLSVLKCGKTKGIQFKTLEAICNALECQPGDLLENVDVETYNKLFRRSEKIN
jgi:putative transcriptional regulator